MGLRLQSMFSGVLWAAFFRAALIFSLYPLWESGGRGPPVRQRAHGIISSRERKTERTHGSRAVVENKRMDKDKEAERTADTGGKPGKFFFPLVILLAVLAAVSAVCLVKSGGGKGKRSETWGGSVRVEVGAGEREENENPLSGRNIYFSGVEDAVIGMDGVVRLENNVENGNFLMKYEVYEAEGGELVYESGLLASGESVDWMPGISLGAGEYTLTYLQIPCYTDGEGNYISLTRGSCQAWIKIREN